MKPVREWVTPTGRMPIQTATVPTSSQKWQPSIIMILMPFKFVFLTDRSWEQGEMGRRDLLDQLGAQLVHNLPVRWGCCWVLHPWHVPGGLEEKKSDLELEIKFRRTRWTVSTPSSMAWGNRTEWRDLSSRAGWTRTSSTTSRARCGRWGTCIVQTMPCSLTQEPRGEVFIRLEGFQFHLPPSSDWVLFPRYKWLVFNPECNTINKEISLTLSRSSTFSLSL